MKNTPVSRRWLALGEILLAPLSFLCYRIVRCAVQSAVALSSRMQTRTAAQWRPLEGQAVRKPFNLLALMTSAPRWNTHALLALAGPVSVRQTLKIHAASAWQSARAWAVVVHAEPGHRIVTSLGSLNASEVEEWQTLSLPPGSYRLALRYYHWSESVELPAVEVDGAPAVDALSLSAHTNDFYHDLSRCSNFFYLCLHSYVCTLLRYRRWFPTSFVAREYLPAGNPQTTFLYGFLHTGERLIFDLDPALLQTHDVYFTLYNRASFPILWYPLPAGRQITAPSPRSGSYLIRIQQKKNGQFPFDRDQLRINVHTANRPENAERRISKQIRAKDSGLPQDAFN